MTNAQLNATDILTVGWVSDPDGRGTSSLILTCLVTLGLCVWSAVHLSIPERNQSSFQHTLQYMKWSIIGIFGPELVVFVAWKQYISAQAMLKDVEVEESRDLPPKPSEVSYESQNLQLN